MTLRRKLSKSEWQFVGGMAILIGCACAPSRPTPLNFAGDWSGTTSQGRKIAFTVSPDLRITVVSVDYSFGGCTGNVTASPNVALTNTSATAAAVVTFTSGPAVPSRTTVNFLFPSITRASGSVEFADFGTCGSTSASWTATKG
jgi:hypothetical protein